MGVDSLADKLSEAGGWYWFGPAFRKLPEGVLRFSLGFLTSISSNSRPPSRKVSPKLRTSGSSCKPSPCVDSKRCASPCQIYASQRRAEVVIGPRAQAKYLNFSVSLGPLWHVPGAKLAFARLAGGRCLGRGRFLQAKKDHVQRSFLLATFNL